MLRPAAGERALHAADFAAASERRSLSGRTYAKFYCHIN
jgi:hypothetical protein